MKRVEASSLYLDARDPPKKRRGQCHRVMHVSVRQRLPRYGGAGPAHGVRRRTRCRR